MISRDDISAAIELLCERFPRTFFQFERRRVPLKIGIYDDILASLGDAIDRPLLKLALRFYTHNRFYRTAQKQGAPRIDLDGNPAGTVSEADALSAASDVMARNAAYRERQRLKPKPSPEAAPPPPSPLPSLTPQKDGLASLRAAARQRKEAVGGDQNSAHAADRSERSAAS